MSILGEHGAVKPNNDINSVQPRPEPDLQLVEISLACLAVSRTPDRRRLLIFVESVPKTLANSHTPSILLAERPYF